MKEQKFPKGHKPGCTCGVCKAIRREYLGENNPAYGKSRPDLVERMLSDQNPMKTLKLRIELKENNPSKRPEVRAKQSKAKKGKTLEELGHKPNCNCPVCKASRGELRGLKRPKFGESIREENNPNWKNGIGKLPYPFEFTKQLKESIRERDNHICQLCGKTEQENGRKLDVHHIDYNKENLDENNLISLCRNCHSKTHNNRENWILVLSEINCCWLGT